MDKNVALVGAARYNAGISLKMYNFFENSSITPFLFSSERATVDNYFHIPNVDLPVLRHISRLFYVKKIREKMRELNISSIHANYLTHYGFFASLLDIHPLVVSCSGTDVVSSNPLVRKINSYVMKKADLLHSQSELYKNKMVDMGAEEDKIVVFPFGVDLEKFNLNVDGNEVREEFNIEDKIVIGSYRILGRNYNIDTIIKTFYMLQKYHDNLSLLLVGPGSQRRYLEDLVNSLGLKNKVIFTGVLPYEKMPSYISACDIYVQLPDYDHYGLTAAEAMACGKPVISSDTGSIREFMDDGYNGFILKNNADLKEKLGYLIDDENLRKSFAERNFKTIKKRCDLEITKKRMVELHGGKVFDT